MTQTRLLTCCSLLLMSQMALSADGLHSSQSAGMTPKTSTATVSKLRLESLKERLRERNYLVESDASGHVKKLTFTHKSAQYQGKNSHPAAGKITTGLPDYPATSFSVPEAYRNTPSGSVHRIHLSAGKLGKLQKGSRVELNLPGGKKHVLVQDEVHRDGKGGLVWAGHLDQSPDGGRTLLSLDRNGAEGQIMTPEGLYRIESRNGETWLVDVGAAGWQAGRFYADESYPENYPVKTLRGSGLVRYRHASETDYAAKATLSPGGLVIIDLVVGYTRSLADSDFQRKLKLLIALTNQAFRDSKINISLRLAGTQAVDYPDESDNDNALNDLTENVGSLKILQNLKQKTNADAVMLLRSFVPSTQGGCGSAWVNGSNSSPMNADHAYAVVSLGAGGNQYCSNYALAHELGHILGATHDAAHSTTMGRFPYSYGYGMENRFGDIMSYYSPEIGVFSNPDVIACDGLPCGIADQSDLAKTFNITGRTVSGFGSAE